MPLLLLCYSAYTIIYRDTWMNHRSKWFSRPVSGGSIKGILTWVEFFLAATCPVCWIKIKGILSSRGRNFSDDDIFLNSFKFTSTSVRQFLLQKLGAQWLRKTAIFGEFTVVDGINRMHLLPLLPAVLPKGISERDKTSWLKTEAGKELYRCCMTKNVVWSLIITMYN